VHRREENVADDLVAIVGDERDRAGERTQRSNER
jgi:hypothetical protein